jgi:hypothetical protein
MISPFPPDKAVTRIQGLDQFSLRILVYGNTRSVHHCLSKQRCSSRTQIATPNSIEYARIDTDCFTVGERNIELPVVMQDEATIDVCGGKVRIELGGLIEIGNRPLMATLLVPD